MAVIQNLIALFTADTRSFESGTKRAQQSLRSTAAASLTLQKTLVQLAGAYIGARGIYNAFKSTISAAMQQEKAEIELAAALGETDLVTRKSVETYKAFASEMQRQTVYADDLIISQMAYAKNLGVTEDKLKEATKAAIGLAAGYKIELASAMMLVGRASQGQTQMLTRYGIVIDQNLSAQEKYYKVLEIGTGKFYLAQAAAKTTAGTFEQWKNAVNDLQEALGEGLLPTLTELVRAGTKLTQAYIPPEEKWYDFTVNLNAFFQALKTRAKEGETSLQAFMRAYAEAVEGYKPFKGEPREETPLLKELDLIKQAQEAYRALTGDVEAFTAKVREYRKGLPVAAYAIPKYPKEYERLLNELRDLAIEEREELLRSLDITYGLVDARKAAREEESRMVLEELESYQAKMKSVEAVEKILDGMRREIDMVGDVTQSWERSREAAELHAEAIKAAVGNAEEYNRIMAEGQRLFDELRYAERWREVTDAASSALSDFAETAILEFKNITDAAKQAAREILMSFLRAFYFKPMGEWIGYGLQGLLGGIKIGLPSPPATAAVPHSGGMVGVTPFPQRIVPSRVFDYAPRLHRGLAPDEYPAILQAGERVVPRGGSATGNVIINIENKGSPLKIDSYKEIWADADTKIVNVVVDNYYKNGPIRQLLQER